jgi:DNA (cytosine-5)-methyltransferase 1
MLIQAAHNQKGTLFMSYTVASLFCGAGGLDLGFDMAGFKTLWANDFNKDACDTHRAWSGAEVVCGDVKTIESNSIPDTDIMLGGFPCQGFSLAGPRRLDDSRNSLYRQYVRILTDKQPMAFVGENVKGLLTMGNGQIMPAVIQAFSDCGYDVYYKLLNAKDYGVPESRERVIIVGLRHDLGLGEFEYPQPSDKMVTLRDTIGEFGSPADEDVCQASYSSRYMSRNRKRQWDEVSFTIPAMAKQCPLWPGSPDMVKLGKDLWRFGDGGQTRRLSWQEAAAIQTFPKDMDFAGNLDSKYRQIGNAVPCLLGKAVADQLKLTLDNR